MIDTIDPDEGEIRMENFTIAKENGGLVSCVREIPEKPRGIVVVIHGFSSSKSCATYRLLLRRLPAAGYGMIGIELPGHGTEESRQETLRIEGAVDSIEAAERYARSRWPELPIFYFASSFGAYLTGLYISTRAHTGKRAFFRSAAVNMPSLFVKEHPGPYEQKLLKELDEKGYFDTNAGLGNTVRITKEMYHDLETTDLFQSFRPNETKVMMAHGAEDTVIDPKAAIAFAERFDIPIVVFENEGHSLGASPETPERVADLAISFYEEETEDRGKEGSGGSYDESVV